MIRRAAAPKRKIIAMSTFKAIVIDKTDAGQTARLTDFDDKDLMDGDVTVRIEWSTVNYKDGLALTGKAPVVRRFPMIGGVDFAGTVESSSHPAWKAADKVVLNGWGLGETRLGAYAEKARVKGATGWCGCPPAWMRGPPWRSARPVIRRCSLSWRLSVPAWCRPADRSL